MPGNAEHKLELIIAARTEKAEAGLKRVRERFIELRPSTDQLAASFTRASAALDVRPMHQVSEEVQALKRHFLTLYESGKLSQNEIAQAAANLRTKIAAVRGEQAAQAAVQEKSIGVTSRLTSRITALVGAYIGLRTVSTIIGGIADATRDAGVSQFNLAASATAASREFENTGTLEHWRQKVKEMSTAIQVYSEADVANATSRTIDMTKRLGLSAAQMEVLIKRSADLSAGKTDLQGGIERVTAALRGEAESSEFLGLTLNETYVAAWHAAHDAHGKAWKDLTDLEKAQVRYSVFLEQSAAMQGRAAASAGTLSGALALVKAEVTNAVAGNKDLATALTGVAHTIRANAGSLGDMAAAIASAIGVTVQLIAENKHLILGLIGAGGLFYAARVTTSGINALRASLDLFSKTRVAAAAAEAAGGMATMSGAALAAKANIVALAIAVATFTLVELYQLIQEYRAWSQASGEAEASQRRLLDTTVEMMRKFEAYKDFKLPGLEGADTRQLEAYRAELAKTHAYWTAFQAQLASRAEADSGDLDEVTADAVEAGFALADVTKRLREVKSQLDIVNAALGTTGQATQASVQVMGLWESAAIRTVEKQQLLTAALAAQAVTEENLKAQVAELGEAYYQAALAAKEMETAGGEGHQKALEDKLKAEAAYVKAVQRLREHQWQQAEESYSDEETRLRQSLDSRMIDLERYLQLEVITQAEYTHKKAQAEEDLAAEIARLRAEAAADAAEIYGEDSREYRQAVEEKIDAEHALQRAVAVTKAKWREMMGISQSGRESAGRLAAALETVGAAGEEGGRLAAEGLLRIRDAAEKSTDSVDRLASAVAASGGGPGTSARGPGGVSLWLANMWDEIGRKLNDIGSLEELAQFGQRNYKWMTATTTADSLGLNTALQRRMQAEMRRRWNEIEMESATQIAAATRAAQEQAIQRAGIPGPRGVAKTVQVQFRAPNGQSITGHFDDDSTGRLLEVLRQSGAVTA